MNLNQITVPSINLNAAIDFYEKLGLNLIVESLPRYARFECPAGDATFSLHRVDELPIGAGIRVYFEVDNMDEIVDGRVKKGIEL